MRLIDADKLELKHFVQRVTEQPISYEGTQPIYANYDIISYDVDNAPTVKAIPIEWLNKRVEEIVFAYWTNARNKMTLPLNELPLLIDQIIGEWEKENETN